MSESESGYNPTEPATKNMGLEELIQKRAEAFKLREGEVLEEFWMPRDDEGRRPAPGSIEYIAGFADYLKEKALSGNYESIRISPNLDYGDGTIDLTTMSNYIIYKPKGK